MSSSRRASPANPMSSVILATEPIELMVPRDLKSGDRNVNEFISEDVFKARKYQNEQKMGLKQKAPNGSKTSIQNYFTRVRIGVAAVAESIKFNKSKDNQVTWANPVAREPVFDPSMRVLQTEQMEQEQLCGSCVTGSDTSLDAPIIGELIELADTATGENRELHNMKQDGLSIGTNSKIILIIILTPMLWVLAAELKQQEQS
ncbi:hypothetical protein NDU88_003328 [Pleurodeles waltl]|uniref:Uncharacterized protein n=1 Tax=Pleurodeles waltl TaxID=8319 RepID=A0AAV7V263_PLEWA|nr:hypothetical protein NDU88_003328 [Pleurodeles waltl]